MAAITTAWRLQLLIGDDEQDWSAWYKAISFGWESAGTRRGRIPKTGTIVISGRATPESIDIRANPARWRPGQPIKLNWWDGSAWQPHPLGANAILTEEPLTPGTIVIGEGQRRAAFDNAISFEVGCNLDYYDFDEPDDDKTQVVIGTATNSAVIAQRLLEEGEIPVAQISLGTWPYDFSSPENKQGGSFVGQAGDYAYSNHRNLYCDFDGIVRAQAVNFAPAAPVITVTLGSDEVRFEPNRDPQKPVELARAVATAQQLESEENPRAEYFPTYGDPGKVLGDSSVGGYGVIASLITEYFTQPEAPQIVFRTTYRELSGKHNKNYGSKIQKVVTARTTNRTYADENGRIYLETTESSASRGTLNPNETERVTNEDAYFERQTEYEFDGQDVTLKTDIKERAAKIKVNIDEADDPYTITDSRSHVTRWREVSPGRYQRHIVDEICAIAQNPNGDYENPYALVTRDEVDASVDDTGSTQPPRTKYLNIDVGQKEVHLEGTALFENAGGDTNRTRERTWQVPYGANGGQLNKVAYDEGYYLFGRHQGALLELPITAQLLAIDYPLFRLDVLDPFEGLTYSYLIDALECNHDEQRHWVEAAGIWLGTVRNGAISPPFKQIAALQGGGVAGALIVGLPTITVITDFAVSEGGGIAGALLESGAAGAIIQGGATAGGDLESRSQGAILQGGGSAGASLSSGVVGAVLQGGGVAGASLESGVSDLRFGEVSSLLHMNGVDGSTTFTDSSQHSHTVNALGNAQIDTSQSKFGGASGRAGSTTASALNYLSIPNDSTLNPGSQNFTIEAWVRWDTQVFTSNFSVVVAAKRQLSSNIGFAASHFNGDLYFSYSTNGTAFEPAIIRPFAPTPGTWHHIAWCRSTNTLRVFVDGVQIGADATLNATIFASTTALTIFADGVNATRGVVNIDDHRFTVGSNADRYTANFTPPTAPFPDQ